MIERIFRLMIFSILMSAPQGHSAELCDIYKTPGDCLRQPENVLDGLGFVRSRIHQLSKDNDLTVLETPASRNPLGLVVYVYIKSNKICGIRYSQSTDISAMGKSEFDDFKSRVVIYYDESSWIERRSNQGESRVYDDGKTSIVISHFHVTFKAKECE